MNKKNNKASVRELFLYSAIAAGITVVNVAVSSLLLF
jgi:hypothetical protein